MSHSEEIVQVVMDHLKKFLKLVKITSDQKKWLLVLRQERKNCKRLLKKLCREEKKRRLRSISRVMLKLTNYRKRRIGHLHAKRRELVEQLLNKIKKVIFEAEIVMESYLILCSQIPSLVASELVVEVIEMFHKKYGFAGCISIRMNDKKKEEFKAKLEALKIPYKVQKPAAEAAVQVKEAYRQMMIKKSRAGKSR